MHSSHDKEKILVVDDTPGTLEVLQRNLRSQGYVVYAAAGVREAVNLLQSAAIDLVITDWKMPKANGMDLVRHVRENFRDTNVMMITGYATVTGAVQAIKAGAEEYLAKPFTDEELFSSVRKSLDKLASSRLSRKDPSDVSGAYGMLGRSEGMLGIYRVIEKAASTPATVLITGESGSGKELVARAIHYSSLRASAPFVPVNCGGIPEGLLESELFGYVKGAFTGATESRAGFFQTAEGGTIFLDEISETGAGMQVKLLRVLQDREVYMVGDSRSRKVDVRIIAATNKNLRTLIDNRAFREDLFFRVNVITIDIPPLRERENDIVLLANHFAARFASELGKAVPRFSENALEVLRNYRWPGNVRELENVVQRIVVMNDDEVIDVPDLPSLARFSALSAAGVNRTLVEVEAEHIRNVLASADGNKSRCAQILGIDRKTLREKIARYHLEATLDD